jgi:hypothetical protein
VTLAQYNQHIKNFICGDSLRIERTLLGIPSGTTISKAYLTIKTTATDVDASAIVQLSITSTSTASGQITDTGADGTGAVRFTLSNTQTLLLTPDTPYYFDVQTILSDGGIYTPCKGTIEGLQQITIATT